MATYVPQLTAYSPDNVYTDYRYTSPQGGYYNMPNCVRYAYGRWWCILGYQPTGLGYLGNAENWFANCTAFAKIPATDPNCVPKLGAIVCFADGPFSGLGHVAVVEKIYSNGSILTSESGYHAYMFKCEKVGNRSTNWGYHSAYKFQGFIYLPEDFDPPDPGPDPPPDPDPDPHPQPPYNPFGFNKPLWFYCKRRPF